jgi:hypothetical protein
MIELLTFCVKYEILIKLKVTQTSEFLREKLIIFFNIYLDSLFILV